MPAAGSAWPPPHLADVYLDYAENDAWYSGDKQRLADFYGTAIARRERGESLAAYTTRLWAQGRQTHRHETRIHVPLAGDIAATSADLLFSEPPAITVTDTATQDRLDEILDEGGAHMRLLEAAEVCSGIGDVYLKLAWDAEIAARPIIAVEHGDAAVPVFKWGRLMEVTFWREVDRNGDTVHRRLEHHEPGAIVYGLFQGTGANLGKAVPLDSHADTAALAKLGDADGLLVRQATGIAPLLTATHVPNMRPSRRHRGTPFGRSDYAAPAYDLFDGLDQVWTSWMRDIRLAKSRIIVPRGYLTDLGPGNGAAFDADREAYQELDMPPGTTQGGGITLNQFAIRVDEHERSTAALVSAAIRAAGYSEQSFGLAGEVAVTATEVAAKERRSLITTGRKGRYWIPALRRILEALLALDRALGWSTVTPEQPEVVFPDTVSPDPEATARTVQLWEQARAASIETKVRWIHPDWDETRIAQEVEAIRNDSGALDPADAYANALRTGDEPVPGTEQPNEGEPPADDEE